MFLEGIVEVAVGLIFAWLVLSIACMQVQEWIATKLKWRANDMETAIRNMLGNKAWAEQLYRHPIVQGLSKKIGIKPSYIPADKFAVALFDIVATAGTDGSVIQRNLTVVRDELNKAPEALLPLVKYTFKKWEKAIGAFFIGAANFLADRKIVTMDMRYKELLDLAGKATTSETAMRDFLKKLVNDETYKRIKKGPAATPADAKTKNETPKTGNESEAPKTGNESEAPKTGNESEAPKTGNENEAKDEAVRFTAEDFIKYFSSKNNSLNLEDVLFRIYQVLDNSYFSKLKDHSIRQQFSGLTIDKLSTIIEGIKKFLADDKVSVAEILKFESLNQAAVESVKTGLEYIRNENPDLHRSLTSLTTTLRQQASSPKLMRTIKAQFENASEIAAAQETHLASMRKSAETWFNDAMERLTGWYKRKTQVAGFIVGVVLALLVNVDSINIAVSMWREPTLRKAVNTLAEEFVKQQSEEDLGNVDVQQIQGQLMDLTVPIGWFGDPISLAAEDESTGPDTSNGAGTTNTNGQGEAAADEQTTSSDDGNDGQLERFLWFPICTPSTFAESQLPQTDGTQEPEASDAGTEDTGIEAAEGNTDEVSPKPDYGIQIGENTCYPIINAPANRDDWMGWGLKILGILISGLAAMQGAPFWFDILKKIINIRGTGTNPTEEQQKRKPAAI